MPVSADSRGLMAMQTTAHHVATAWGAIDLVFCNAGALAAGKFAETTPAAWNEVVVVNLTGTGVHGLASPLAGATAAWGAGCDRYLGGDTRRLPLHGRMPALASAGTDGVR